MTGSHSVSTSKCQPCRQASKRILAVLQRFGVCERGGMDEMLVDVTAEAQRRIAQGSVPATWAAHVHSNKVQQHVASLSKSSCIAVSSNQ